jgi:intergrase/recombinase
VDPSRAEFKKPRVALFGTDYQWLRSDDEIRRFLAAAQAEDEQVFVFYAVAIFTGMRAG